MEEFPLGCLAVRPHQGWHVIKMMEWAERLVAIRTALAFIPFGNDVPHQAFFRIGFDLPEALLSTVLALRPTRALIQAKSRLADKGPCGHLSGRHVHGLGVSVSGQVMRRLPRYLKVSVDNGENAEQNRSNHDGNDTENKKSTFHKAPRQGAPNSDGQRPKPLPTYCYSAAWGTLLRCPLVTEICDCSHWGCSLADRNSLGAGKRRRTGSFVGWTVLLHSQIGQHLGIFFTRRQNLMACGTVVGDGLAIGTGVTAVMAAEAARRIIVAEIIRDERPRSHACPGKCCAGRSPPLPRPLVAPGVRRV